MILLHVGGKCLLRKVTLLHKMPKIASVLQARKTQFWAFYAIEGGVARNVYKVHNKVAYGSVEITTPSPLVYKANNQSHLSLRQWKTSQPNPAQSRCSEKLVNQMISWSHWTTLGESNSLVPYSLGCGASHDSSDILA